MMNAGYKMPASREWAGKEMQVKAKSPANQKAPYLAAFSSKRR